MQESPVRHENILPILSKINATKTIECNSKWLQQNKREKHLKCHHVETFYLKTKKKEMESFTSGAQKYASENHICQ